MLKRAELALASGNFLQANRISKQTGSMLDRTQSLHRKFMKKMKRFLDRIMDMEERGFDISEAMSIMERAKETAIRSDYEKALNNMDRVDTALERATYMPFPLLNKTVDIISTVFYSRGKVSYTVRIENPTEEPLGEIIISPSFSEDEFQKVPEKPFGIVGPREYKEYTFYLNPMEGKNWNLGIGREVLMEEGVTMKTKLSSRSGEAKYLVVVENNSDQVIRDLVVSPQAPGGLKADPSNGIIDGIEPFSTGSVTFDLYPAVLDTHQRPRTDEKIIVVEDEQAYHPGERIGFETEREGNEEEFVIAEKEEDEEELTFEEDIEEEEISEGPRDFTPVKEEYDLIEMAPGRYPEEVERALKKKKKKRKK